MCVELTCSLHQGVVVEKVEDASHVIYPAPPPPPSEEEYLRPIELRGKSMLVHWWYFPDRWEYNQRNCMGNF